MRRPAARNNSVKTPGMVISEGPVSKRKPAASTRFILPPACASCSHTVTWQPAAARRTAVASPPTPAPTTATRRPAATLMDEVAVDHEAAVVVLRATVEDAVAGDQ